LDLVHRLADPNRSREVDNGFNVVQGSVSDDRIPYVAMDKRDTLGEERLVSKVDLGLETVEDDDFIAEFHQAPDDV
jgi:hypothetical protein